MKVLKSRWSFLIIGLVLGAYLGSDLALRFCTSREKEYDHVIEDNHVERRIWTIITSTSTISKAEDAELESIIADHRILLRTAFLTLVELHKSGRYQWKEADMRKFLRRAKEFMAERPKGFIEMELVTITPEGEKPEEPRIQNDAANTAGALQARKSLQEAFDYVDSLPIETRNE